MARTKAQRKQERKVKAERKALNLPPVPEITPRDARGVQRSLAARSRQARAAKKPPLTHRKDLFPDGQKGKAWDPKAGYPLGVYLLRGEITQEHHDAGVRYAAGYVLAARVMMFPHPYPKTARLDEVVRTSFAKDWQPSKAVQKRVTDFIDRDRALNGLLPSHYKVLRLCLIMELMGKRSERKQGGETAPEYNVTALKEILDEVIKRRI